MARIRACRSNVHSGSGVDMTLREQIRALLDKLGPEEWSLPKPLYLTLPEPRTSRANFEVTLCSMAADDQARKKKAPKGSGKGARFVYRPGRKPVVDGRIALKGVKKPKSRVGFAELARLEVEDPAEFRRLTRMDGREWKRGRAEA